jgi:hypothetical protein
LIGLQRYLVQGLQHPSSWMLDQNPLSYAVERFGGGVENVNGYPRPIRTMKFMSTGKKNYRRMAARRASAG